MSEDSGKINPGATFYLKFNVFNSDGTLQPDCEANTADEDIQSILLDTIDDIEDHGGAAYIYECKAVRKVVRGKTRVMIIKPKR